MSTENSVKSLFDFLHKYVKEDSTKDSKVGVLTVQKKIEEQMLANDVHPVVVNKIMIALRNHLVNDAMVEEGVDTADVVCNSFRSLLISSMRAPLSGVAKIPDRVFVIKLYGLYGAGKTAFCGKLAYLIKKEMPDAKVALGTLDHKRKAGQEQLEALAFATGSVFVRNDNISPSMSSIAVGNMIEDAQAQGCDFLIFDTPGLDVRSSQAVSELQSIHSSSHTDLGLLIVDSMMGKMSYDLTERVRHILPVDGIVMSKAVENCGAGSIINARFGLRKPVMYVSFSEVPTDVRRFNFLDFANDLMSEVSGPKRTVGRGASGRKFENFYDLKKYLAESKSLENLSLLTAGVKDKKESRMRAVALEIFLDAQIAIINSMTNEERANPALIDRSRVERISKGSGSTVGQVVALCSQVCRNDLLAS